MNAMPQEIELIPFLAKIVQEHTTAYQSDFEYDIAALRRAARETQEENRAFYWMSRPHGTWCVKEREVFLCESNAHTIWTHYEAEPAGIVAYGVCVTGEWRGNPVGHVWRLNYPEQVRRVKRAALPVETVTLFFKNMPPVTMTYEELHGSRLRLADQYGEPMQIRYAPRDEAELARVIAAEHRLQTAPKRKPPGRTAPTPAR